jgi:hypothetical protein
MTFVFEMMSRRSGVDRHSADRIDHLAIVWLAAARVVMAVIVARFVGVRRGPVGPFM